MGDERLSGSGRVEIVRDDEWAAAILDALPEEQTGLSTEAECWRHAMRVYLSEHAEDFR